MIPVHQVVIDGGQPGRAAGKHAGRPSSSETDLGAPECPLSQLFVPSAPTQSSQAATRALRAQAASAFSRAGWVSGDGGAWVSSDSYTAWVSSDAPASARSAWVSSDAPASARSAWVSSDAMHAWTGVRVRGYLVTQRRSRCQTSSRRRFVGGTCGGDGYRIRNSLVMSTFNSGYTIRTAVRFSRKRALNCRTVLYWPPNW